MDGKVFYMGKPHLHKYSTAIKWFYDNQINNLKDILIVGDTVKKTARLTNKVLSDRADSQFQESDLEDCLLN